MSSYNVLREKISSKKAKIAIIGLGYVGLPLAVSFANKGWLVYGYDTNTKRVDRLRNGKKYITDIDPASVTKLIRKRKLFPTTDAKSLSESDVLIICVPTPLRKVKTPDISYIVKATRTIKKHLRKGQLIILESTTYPGTSREAILPLLKDSGLTEEKDFFLSFSPERIDPGNKKYPLNKIPKVVGGISTRSIALTKKLYSNIIEKIVPVSSIETAEIVKLLENSFRLVNIGLANEFALVCNKLGINVWEVIRVAATKPFGFTPFYPGPGVGGHCIPADPVYLSWKARKLGFKTKMIDLASYTNHFMPKYVVDRIKNLLKLNPNPKVLMVGVTYKKDVKDLRDSPALDIIDNFRKEKVPVDYYDPLMPYLKLDEINLKNIKLTKKSIRKYDCVLIVTDHAEVDYGFLQKNARLIFDTRNVYKKDYKNVIRL